MIDSRHDAHGRGGKSTGDTDVVEARSVELTSAAGMASSLADLTTYLERA